MELSQKELAEIEGVTAKQICRRETERLTWNLKVVQNGHDTQVKMTF